ncbi:MarR family transcriptional regulator [uncultured Methanobrevibacter sp.]|uniref:MarR family winged helix-turn-helix transcriptional regulator n=1 Tax=uncultured Methanobrevibacter sp. TaxID=253161 RepID=UPI002634FCAA
MVNNNENLPDYFNQIMIIVKSYESFFKNNIDSLNVTIGEIHILLAIYKKEGQLNQIDLVRQFHVTEANISKTTKHLLNKGLIIKEIDEENNTKKLIYLTEKGKEICKQLFDLFEQWANEMLKGIDDDELLALTASLEKISRNAENAFL